MYNETQHLIAMLVLSFFFFSFESCSVMFIALTYQSDFSSSKPPLRQIPVFYQHALGLNHSLKDIRKEAMTGAGLFTSQCCGTEM